MSLNLSRFSCIGEAIRESSVPFKSNLALVEINRDLENGRWSHLDLRREAERFAAYLQDHGVVPGDLCAIVLSNQSKWVISGLGIYWSGAVLVPLDYKLTPPELHGLLTHSQPKCLIIEWPIWQKLSKESSSIATTTKVLVTEAPEGADLNGAYRWEDSPQGSFQFHRRNREDIASIIYSSGTGGRAKGCMLSHGGFLTQVEQLHAVVSPVEDDRYFSIIPTNHAIDFMCGFLMPLICGASVVHQRTLRPQYLVETMKNYRITLLALVPLLLKMIKQGIEEKIEALPAFTKSLFEGIKTLNETMTRKQPRPGLSRMLFKGIHDRFGGSLRQIIVGGAYVDRNLAEYFYRIGLPVAIGYGLTEAGTAITLNDLKPFRGDTVGLPLPGMELEIRNPDEGGIGEIWASGPTLMKGYLDDPELTAETLVKGWLRTGDLGKMDASGHLKIVGRSKNMVVTEGGKNVYPEDIENAFEDISDWEEFCIFAANYIWPEGRLIGEQLIVVFRPKGDGVSEILLEGLRKRNRHLADYKRISGFVVHERDFPRTSSMKIKRQQLAQELKSLRKREEALRPLKGDA
ncbi:MAG: AMP-binding protein [Deltaproteobacteria bacterium]|nr:AMP-binding protein [Deltaproteobacteria bacterium]